MSQAANVISFPVDAGTTDLLRDLIGDAGARLDAVTHRIEGIAALASMAKDAEGLPPHVAAAFGGIESMLRDCLLVAELRPVGSRA